MRRRVALVGSGTAGHVRAALAVGEAYRKLRADVEVLFLGSRHGFRLESRLVPGAGERLELIDARPVMGTGLAGAARAAASLVAGFAQARRILRAHGAEVVVGFGGYATPAVIVAARSLGLHTAIHEANVVPGRANRLLQRYANHVFLACETTETWRAAGAVSVVGYPVGADVAALAKLDRAPPDIAGRPVRVFIAGGSLGSAFLNREAPRLMSLLRESGLSVEVVHQTGNGNDVRVSEDYARHGITAQAPAYLADPAARYRWADLVVCTAGAATLAEVAAAGLPALIVPMSGVADDHQRANALRYAGAGAISVAEADWRAHDVAARLGALLRSPPAWKRAAAGMRSLARPGAAMAIARQCEDMVVAAGSCRRYGG